MIININQQRDLNEVLENRLFRAEEPHAALLPPDYLADDIYPEENMDHGFHKGNGPEGEI